MNTGEKTRWKLLNDKTTRRKQPQTRRDPKIRAHIVQEVLLGNSVRPPSIPHRRHADGMAKCFIEFTMKTSYQIKNYGPYRPENSILPSVPERSRADPTDKQTGGQ